eukprot:scaffold260521_cov13-Tisochrysis_lutea.AAC.1
MDVPLLWKELDRTADLGGRWSCSIWHLMLPVAPCSPRPSLLLNGYREFVLVKLYVGVVNYVSGQLEVILCFKQDKLSGKPQGK